MRNRLLAGCVAIVTAVALSLSNTGFVSYAAKSNTTQKQEYVGKYYSVIQDGTGDFSTIQEGVDAVNEGDTLVIYPGIYEEIVSVIGKEINLVGVDRDLCIIRYDSISYRQAPLIIGAGKVSNLTIYGMYTGSNAARELTDEEIADYEESLQGTDTWERQKNYTGYAVHIDQNYSYGRTLTFENCRIISENSYCLGIGLRGSSSITLNNCELTSMGEGGCIYMHDSQYPTYTGESHLIMTNCLLTNYLSPYIMSLESIYPDSNKIYYTFQNVKTKTVAFSYDAGYGTANINTFWDVDTLSLLQKANLLGVLGYTTTATELVNYLTPKESAEYMDKVLNSYDSANYDSVLNIQLDEGITYITDNSEQSYDTDSAKRQVIAIYNRNNLPGDGWLGINSGYLTPDSYGNTLIEMNYPVIQQLLY